MVNAILDIAKPSRAARCACGIPADDFVCHGQWPDAAEVERCDACGAVTSYRIRIAMIEDARLGTVSVFDRKKIGRVAA